MRGQPTIKEVRSQIFGGDDVVVRYYPSSLFDPYNLDEVAYLLERVADRQGFIEFLFPRQEQTDSTTTIHALRPEALYAVTDQENRPFKLIVSGEGGAEFGSVVGESLDEKLAGKYQILRFNTAKLPGVNFSSALVLTILPIRGEHIPATRLPVTFKDIQTNIRLKYQIDEGLWKEHPFTMPEKKDLTHLEARLSDLEENTRYRYEIVYRDEERDVDFSLMDPVIFHAQPLPTRLRIRAGPIAIGDGRRTSFSMHLLLLLDERTLDQRLPLTPFHRNFDFFRRFNPVLGFAQDSNALLGLSFKINSLSDIVVGGMFGTSQSTPFGFQDNFYYGVNIDLEVLKTIRKIFSDL